MMDRDNWVPMDFRRPLDGLTEQEQGSEDAFQEIYGLIPDSGLELVLQRVNQIDQASSPSEVTDYSRGYMFEFVHWLLNRAN